MALRTDRLESSILNVYNNIRNVSLYMDSKSVNKNSTGFCVDLVPARLDKLISYRIFQISSPDYNVCWVEEMVEGTLMSDYPGAVLIFFNCVQCATDRFCVWISDHIYISQLNHFKIIVFCSLSNHLDLELLICGFDISMLAFNIILQKNKDFFFLVKN